MPALADGNARPQHSRGLFPRSGEVDNLGAIVPLAVLPVFTRSIPFLTSSSGVHAEPIKREKTTRMVLWSGLQNHAPGRDSKD